MHTREHIHQLVDDLPDNDLPDLLRAIERLLAERRSTADPLLAALAHAAEDDEPVTRAEDEAIQEGIDAIAGGDVVSSADVRRRLGV